MRRVCRGIWDALSISKGAQLVRPYIGSRSTGAWYPNNLPGEVPMPMLEWMFGPRYLFQEESVERGVQTTGFAQKQQD